MWATIGVELQTPLPRMSYEEAMRRFGTDKPDLRFGLELIECTDYFAGGDFGIFQAPYVGAVVMPGGAEQPRRVLDEWQEWAKQRGAKGLAYVLVGDDGELRGPVAKNLSESERAGLAAHTGARPGDCIFFAAGAAKPSRALLGALRGEIAARLDLIDSTAWAFTWIVDAPRLRSGRGRRRGTATWRSARVRGRPRTMPSPHPRPSTSTRSRRTPGRRCRTPTTSSATATRSAAAASGSTRRELQERVFQVMGIPPEEAREKFGFLLEAFAFGAPPHGGFAMGFDRIVSLLAGTDSIRDVIAFPKSGGGSDPLTGAPAELDPAQQTELYRMLGVRAVPQG